ncbi:hypothetical protein B296_00042373 [Ensete ventricosum]|uniref:Uncharacterized protein n=1 Tax=Ensete ventricosum TaxID=4639 RepID=A0A426Y9M7_ENSVE|nr:hypothetical protein B296_00042373 [Ensete ventricosum]
MRYDLWVITHGLTATITSVVDALDGLLLVDLIHLAASDRRNYWSGLKVALLGFRSVATGLPRVERAARVVGLGGSGGRRRRIGGDDLHERGSGDHCVGGGLGFWASGDAGDRLMHLLLKDGEERRRATMTARRSTKGGPPVRSF